MHAPNQQLCKTSILIAKYNEQLLLLLPMECYKLMHNVVKKLQVQGEH
jgi:hypothetical protein